MRKYLITLALAVFVLAAQGNAQKFGVYGGYPGGVGGMFFVDDMRISVGLPIWFGMSVDGGLDLMLGEGPLTKDPPLTYYYGAGVNLGFYSEFLGKKTFYGDIHGLVGAKYPISEQNSLFVEFLAGPGYRGVENDDKASGLFFSYGLRIGVYFY